MAYPFEVTYTIKVQGQINAITTPDTSLYQFDLKMKNPCVDPQYNWINTPEPSPATLTEVVYSINLDEKQIVGIPSMFSVQNALCGLIDL